MSDFKGKMHQNRFQQGLCPRPHWERLQCSPDPLAGLGGLRLRGGRGMVGKIKGWEGKGGEGRERGGREGMGETPCVSLNFS